MGFGGRIFRPGRAVRKTLYILIVAGVLLTVLAAVPSFFRLGPLVEAAVYPVVTTKICHERITEGRLYFRLCGEKLRPCPVKMLPWRWTYDHTLQPVAAHLAATGEVYSPTTLIASGKFDFGELYVDIPDTAYGLPEVEFGGVTFHECHPSLWLIPHEFSVKVQLKRNPDGKLSMAVINKEN